MLVELITRKVGHLHIYGNSVYLNFIRQNVYSFSNCHEVAFAGQQPENWRKLLSYAYEADIVYWE